MLDNCRVLLIGELMILLGCCDAGGTHLLIMRDVCGCIAGLQLHGQYGGTQSQQIDGHPCPLRLFP